MRKLNKQELDNPMILVFIAFIISSVCYEAFSRDRLLAIFIAGSFFIILYLYKKMLATIFILFFFLIGILNNYWYFTYKPSNYEIVRIEKINNYNTIGKIDGRKVNIIASESDFKEGDRLVSRGQFVSKLTVSDGIIGDYKIENYEIMKKDLLGILRIVREKIYKEISDKIGERKAGIITSVAFGYSKSLNGQDREDMKSLGISHAIAVSGLHMALVYGVLRKLFGDKVSLGIALLYVIFTGAAPSSIRAFIMILMVSLSSIVKRNYNSISALCLAGVFLILIRPYDIFSLGFLLSFLATVGIILHNKKINRSLYKLPKYFRNGMSLSLASQIYTFPIIIFSFNEFSLNFILGNLIVLPLLNIIVILGNLLLILMPIKTIFNFLLYISFYVIKFMDRIMLFINNIELDMLYINSYLGYFYLALLITFYFYKKGFKRFIFFPIIMGIYIGILIYSPVPTIKYLKEGALEISYKGEKSLIQTSNKADIEKIMSISNVYKVYDDVKKITIGGQYILTRSGKNYLLDLGSEQYLLKVNYGQTTELYDIIDFRDNNINEIFIVNNKAIVRQ